MTHESDPWERDYGQRGRLYGGAAHPLPSLAEGSRVLEIGCSDGKTAAALAARQYDVVAVDHAPSAASLCRKRPESAGWCGIAVADVRALPFRPQAFDAVTAVHLLGHLTRRDRETAVREMHRTLRDGGHAWFVAFADGDFRAGSGTAVEPGTFRRGTGVITHYFSEDETARLFTAFSVISLETVRWTLSIRGERCLRAEIRGLFRKE